MENIEVVKFGNIMSMEEFLDVNNPYYAELYKACSPKHFKEIKYFSTDGKTMPNGHAIQRGGFIQECKRNSNNFVLTEAVHGKQYGLSDYRGGVIVFSTDVNAVDLDKNEIKNKIKKIIVTFQQHFFPGNKIHKIINKFNKYFNKKSDEREEITAYSIGNTFKGKYIGDNGEKYTEHSMTIEVNGLSSEGLLYLGEMIARGFHQETVLIKDLNKNKFYLANGLRDGNPLDLNDVNVKSE